MLQGVSVVGCATQMPQAFYFVRKKLQDLNRKQIMNNFLYFVVPPLLK